MADRQGFVTKTQTRSVECPNCFLKRKRRDFRVDRRRYNHQSLRPCAECGKLTEWHTVELRVDVLAAPTEGEADG